MASLQLFNSTAKLQQHKHNIAPAKVECHIATDIKIPLKQNSSKSCSLGTHSLPPKHTNMVGNIGKSWEASVSFSTSTQELPLKIGILGLGAFGQFLAKGFQRQGHTVLATSKLDYSEYCQQNGIQFFRHLDDLCEAQPDVLLVCTSILWTEDVVRRIPFHKLKPSTIIADVLSVKQFPKDLLLEVVPPDFGIICTHPMFSCSKNSWDGLRFVYDKVRISEKCIQEHKCDQFLRIFQDEGCKMVEMTCEKHDEYAAESQFLTHIVARILSNMNLEPTPMDTKGYESLVELTQNTVSHGSDNYDGLFLYNVNASKQIDRLDRAIETVKKNLFEKLHDTLRRKMEESVVVLDKTTEAISSSSSSSYFLPTTKELNDLSSFLMVPPRQDDAPLELQTEV